MEIHQIKYNAGLTNCIGKFCLPEQNTNKKIPVVLIAHDWSGCDDFAVECAKKIAKSGYIGFAIDLFGNGKTGNSNEEKMDLIKPLLDNRKELQIRMLAALAAIKNIPNADLVNVGSLGFCFGGMACLDLARSGADLKFTISAHGLLNSYNFSQVNKINSKILLLHGYNDPMVTPLDLNNFINEIDSLCNNWQITMYGHTFHGFTNPNASDYKSGIVYNAEITKNAWSVIDGCLKENFPVI